MAPRARHNFLDLRTIGYSLAVAAVAWWIVGRYLGLAFGAVVYVIAALHPGNVSTCPWCGAGTNPQASVCRSCGRPVR